jgi:hypothetical protein
MFYVLHRHSIATKIFNEHRKPHQQHQNDGVLHDRENTQHRDGHLRKRDTLNEAGNRLQMLPKKKDIWQRRAVQKQIKETTTGQRPNSDAKIANSDARVTKVININNIPVQLTLDTGAEVSSISHRIWNSIGRPSLRTPSVSLSVADGRPLKVRSTFDCDVELNGTRFRRECHVTEHCELLGLDWMKKDPELEKLLQSFSPWGRRAPRPPETPKTPTIFETSKRELSTLAKIETFVKQLRTVEKKRIDNEIITATGSKSCDRGRHVEIATTPGGDSGTPRDPSSWTRPPCFLVRNPRISRKNHDARIESANILLFSM